MKIFILTHHWQPNFGANLQVTSTFHYLKKMGHEVTVLNYRPLLTERGYCKKILKEQIECHDKHCVEMLMQSEVLRNENDLTEYCESNRCDVLILGSDAMFRVRNDKNAPENCRFPNPFWLQWCSRLSQRPRVGVLAASSMGTYYRFLPKAQKRDVARYLCEFDYVSVRDRWTKNMVNHITQGILSPDLCPDPVCLLNDVIDLPESVCQEPRSVSDPYILLSFSPKYLAKNWIHKFVEIAHSKNLYVFSLPMPETTVQLPVDRILPLPMSPLEWYAWIKYSNGVISYRFHPIACSIFNSVPFISLDNSGPMYFYTFAIRRASKTYDLCMSVKGTNRCLLPMAARFFLSPWKAMRFLRDNTYSNIFEPYTRHAQNQFRQCIDKILTNTTL
jgi:hypothetical protein